MINNIARNKGTSLENLVVQDAKEFSAGREYSAKQYVAGSEAEGIYGKFGGNIKKGIIGLLCVAASACSAEKVYSDASPLVPIDAIVAVDAYSPPDSSPPDASLDASLPDASLPDAAPPACEILLDKVECWFGYWNTFHVLVEDTPGGWFTFTRYDDEDLSETIYTMTDTNCNPWSSVGTNAPGFIPGVWYVNFTECVPGAGEHGPEMLGVPENTPPECYASFYIESLCDEESMMSRKSSQGRAGRVLVPFDPTYVTEEEMR